MDKRGSAAKHTFYYLLMLVSLGFTATGVSQILFQIVNALFQETTYNYDTYFNDEVLRFGITSVIIASPIFYISIRAINRELYDKRLDLHSLVRKWLTYLTLLIVSITFLGDLMVVLYNYLSGEITIKFILKSLIIGSVSGLIFSYYFYDISRVKLIKNDKKIKIFKIVFITVITAGLIGGFLFNTKPSVIRAEREDYERTNSLRNINQAIRNYVVENKAMPETLEEIKDNLYSSGIVDPVSKEIFPYEIIDSNTYSICANFTFSNKETNNYRFWRDADWVHDAGKQCFKKKIQKTKENELKEVPFPPSV